MKVRKVVGDKAVIVISSDEAFLIRDALNVLNPDNTVSKSMVSSLILAMENLCSAAMAGEWGIL